MSAKLGRPIDGDAKKDIDIKVRIDRETNNKLIKYSTKHNITKAEAIRKGINLIIKE